MVALLWNQRESDQQAHWRHYFRPGKAQTPRQGPVPHSQECWVRNQLGATSPRHVYTVMLCKLESLFPGTSGRTSWTRVSLLINLGS